MKFGGHNGLTPELQRKGQVKTAELEAYLKINKRSVRKHLNTVSKKYLQWHGKSKTDPTGYYSLLSF